MMHFCKCAKTLRDAKEHIENILFIPDKYLFNQLQIMMYLSIKRIFALNFAIIYVNIFY